MATLVDQNKIKRPTGTGLYGRGPDVDLPSSGNEEEAEPLRIEVRPSDRMPPAEQVNTNPPVGAEAAPPPSESANNYWPQIQDALSQGIDRKTVSKYLQQNLGMSEDDADKQIIDSVGEKIKAARDQGVPDDKIKDYLIQNKFDGSVIDSAMKSSAIPKPWKKYEWDPQTPAEEAKDISDLYKNIHGKYSTLGKQVGGFFDEQTGIEARREINQLNASIAEKLKEQNIDAYINPKTGDLMMRDEKGVEQEVDSSFVNDLYNGKSEIAGAMAGAIAGAKVGAKGPIRIRPYTVAAGMIGGGMFGASLGKAADMTVNASIIKEDLEANLYATQMKEAAIFDGIAGIVGAGMFKMGAAGFKGFMKAYDYALAGNSGGALKVLKENMLLSDDQAKEITEQFMAKLESPPTRKNLLGRDVALNANQQQIAAIASTQQGAESLVKQATADNLKVSNQIMQNVDARAKDLLRGLDSVSDENIGQLVRNDLAVYRKDVKDFYSQVKQIGADNIDGTDFRFDLDKLAIEPVIDSISKKISDPTMRDRFVSYASRIDSATKDRTFSGLVDLRQAVNDFKYSKSGLSVPDKEALNSVINRIDGQINKAVKQYMPDTGKEWTKQFSKAKDAYRQMKLLEENVLYKAVTSKKVSEAQIQRALNKYGNDLDVDREIYNAVVERLAPATRAKVENAAIKNLTKKFTYGDNSELQAINFPALSDALKDLNIATPEARRLEIIIDDMAKVFKNDASLSGVSGNLSVPKFASSLGADIGQKIRYGIIGEVWNAIKTITPGRKGNSAALIKQLSKVLENPMHVKTTEDLIRAIPKESQDEMRSLIKELQVETAKAPKKPKAEWKNMYKQSKTGKLAVSDGALGKGVYLVDKIKNPNSELKVVGREVNLTKMATLKDISNLVGREITEKDIRTIPNLQEQLIQKGYLGIQVDGKAMLFPETTVGVKTPKSK